MKQLFLLAFFCCSIVFTVSAQRNPVKNLDFKHWYSYPKNCFTLKWSAPDLSSTDTLVGYNIYRNNQLYLFTTSTGIEHNPCTGSPSSPYSNFLSFPTPPFYIHVTAVYNFNHVESQYTDSAICRGLMTSILPVNTDEMVLTIYPQPFSSFTTIQTNTILKDASLNLYNALGTLVKEIRHINGKTLIIPRENLAAGLYYLQLSESNQLLGKEKLFITD